MRVNKLFNVAAIIPALFGVVSLTFLLYVVYWPLTPAYQAVRAENHFVRYENGYIYTHREYCINQAVPVTISRDLIRVGAPGSPELRQSLPTTVQVYEKGCHSIRRIFLVPESTPPGNYRLVFTATWAANPFRDESAKLPELSIMIPPRPLP